jgi:hypothetical protein
MNFPMNSPTPPPSLENPRKPTRQELWEMKVRMEARTESFRRELLKKAAAFKLETQARMQIEADNH